VSARAVAQRPLGTLVVFNVLFWSYFLASSALFFVVIVLLWLTTAPFDRRRSAMHAVSSFWAAHYLAYAPGAGVVVRGRERLDPRASYVYASNHASMVDILACMALYLPYRWVSKLENVYVPFIGWALYLDDHVLVRRRDLGSIKRMAKKCHALLASGHSLFVFPEGTRSPDGRLLPFFSGAFRFAARHRRPLVPVVLHGTRDVLGKGRLLVSPHPVTVEVLEPIDPAVVDHDWKKLRDLVRSRMEEALAS
jgi:1-acyl-sn-glycerol-3-phosphate acyltransferase